MSDYKDNQFKIVLASSSPRRKLIFEMINLNFEVKEPNFEERKILMRKDISILDKIKEVAKRKALSIEIEENELIVAADTVVVLENKILGKPENSYQAKEFLRKLSGKWHKVLTAVFMKTIYWEDVFIEETMVKFYELPDEIVEYYVSKYNPFDKAGSYGIQDFAAVFVEKINGDFFNVMGFPVSRFFWKLREKGVKLWKSSTPEKSC